MKNVVYLKGNALMIFFLKNSVIYILAWFKLLLNPLPKEVLMLLCLRDARFKDFCTHILGMITSSLFDGLVYFNCHHDLTLALDDPNIFKPLTINILTSSYDMDEGSKPLAIIYHIYYKLLKTTLNPKAKLKNTGDKTLLIQCSTLDAKVQIPRMIQWKDINLPKEWLLERETQPAKFASDELNLDHIQQYFD